MKNLWNLVGRIVFVVVWPALYVYLHGSQRTRMLVIAEGKVLVVKSWLGDGKWSAPGGGLHDGEAHEDGAIRELREETGLLIQPGQLQGAGSVHRNRGFKYTYHRFIVRLEKRPQTTPQRGEITDIAWKSPSELTPQTADEDLLDLLTA